MLFGLSLNLLNFSPSVTYQLKRANILRDEDTLELLTKLMVVSLRKHFNLETKQPITISNLGQSLATMFKLVTPSEHHALYECFFIHIFVTEWSDPQYYFPYLIKIDKRIFMTPLYQHLLSYAPEVLSVITKQDSAYLFDKLQSYSSMTFTEQLEISWLQRLESQLFTRDNERCLMLAQLPDSVISSLYKIYQLFLTEFKVFPFTSEEIENKQKIYDYLIIVRDYFNTSNQQP